MKKTREIMGGFRMAQMGDPWDKMRDTPITSNYQDFALHPATEADFFFHGVGWYKLAVGNACLELSRHSEFSALGVDT